MKTSTKQIRIFVGLLLLFVLPCTIMAQQDTEVVERGAARTGTAAAQFLQIGVSARATGMGESFVAVVDDASGAFYNPGVLALIENRQAFFNHTDLPAGLAHYFGSYVQPAGRWGTFALSFIALTTGDMPVTVAFQGPTGETFSVTEMAFGLSYSRKLTDRFSLGGTAKLVAQDLAGFENRTVAVDIGTMYRTGYRQARLGMSISNFGPDVDFGKEGDVGFESQSFPLPLTFRFGVAVDILYSDQNKLWLSAELHQPNDNLRYQSVGVEYGFNDLVFLRGGFKIDEENEGPDKEGFAESLSFGGGVNLDVSGINGKFDVSWTQMNNLDDLLRFSVLLGF
jgi:hypothetical protein